MSNYVYIRSEPGYSSLLTVGFYDPKGVWHPHEDFDNPKEAQKMVNFLNGGESGEEIEIIPLNDHIAAINDLRMIIRNHEELAKLKDEKILKLEAEISELKSKKTIISKGK